DAEARELQTGKSRVEFLRELGLKGIQVVPKHAVDDGIAAVRRILPKCYFDKTKCERGINSLSNYQRKWDEKNKIFSSRPLHNWASHGSDAFRTFAMGHREVKVPSHLIHVNQTVAIQDYNVFNPPGGFQ